ncbi:SMI1/KNR4 family protein [Streptomyces sp. A0642]|uniref:SMI1/KNR4 family protein n=1 Tax=Streptomyces sp. A0642 TaxID=2563100 RepID=UPI0010A26E2A|nr:SMI1/KNR4 family protein [Streptomyces sp. A0642]THA76089.1 SMI1/KNR4 family protein [Streptomyces sp. A0642]
MTVDFERQHGFPPGTNEVRPADHDDQAAARLLARAGTAPADLITFYGSIGDATWADVGNGYFVAPAADVLLQLAERADVTASADPRPSGLVIGSNGGGQSYVVAPGGTVYRTRTASLDEPELDRMAVDLRQFLELLEQALTRFIATNEPGHL